MTGNIVGVDLRNPKMDLFKIHTSDKPFSYVEFISSKEIVTRLAYYQRFLMPSIVFRRTDGSVQLWDLESKHIVRGFTSPYEKLTGTKVFDGMIACGKDFCIIYILHNIIV